WTVTRTAGKKTSSSRPLTGSDEELQPPATKARRSTAPTAGERVTAEAPSPLLSPCSPPTISSDQFTSNFTGMAARPWSGRWCRVEIIRVRAEEVEQETSAPRPNRPERTGLARPPKNPARPRHLSYLGVHLPALASPTGAKLEVNRCPRS